MLAVKGLYDGQNIKLFKKVKINHPQNVIIVFPDSKKNDSDDLLHQEIYSLAEKGGSFDFLNDPEEDIYTDDDLKKRYVNG